MQWDGRPLRLYHGSDYGSAAAISTGGIDLAKSKPRSDFGQGFYATTDRKQAESWARQRTAQLGAAQAGLAIFDVCRAALGALSHLAFVQASQDYWSFVAHARRNGLPHMPGGQIFDVVYGPVSRRWQQQLAWPESDQLGFHTSAALYVLNNGCRVERLD